MEWREIQQKFFETGYFVDKMIFTQNDWCQINDIYSSEYEISDKDGNVIKDHLSLKGLNDFLDSL